VIDRIISKRNVNMENATIREMVLLVADIEKELACRFLRMEFGIPGLSPHKESLDAEVKALQNPRITATYPPVAGLPVLKEAGSLFIRKFLDLEIPAEYVIPTVGSMQGGFLAQAVVGRMHEGRKRIAFIDPCFSVHRIQSRFLGLEEASIDLYDRANWLNHLEEVLKKGDVAGVLYSTPNNPSWMILTESELERLGELCEKYDVVAIEDVAYLGMDSRRDYSMPGEPPYPPTVAKYTDNYILLISGAKIFNYAGQRVALAYLSPKLAQKEFPALKKYFGYTNLLNAFVLSGIYCTTSGVSVGPQHGLAALVKKASQGELNFIEATSEYADRARFMKKIFTENGFSLVYKDDLGEPLADGFFFTLSYPKLDGAALVRELLYYGISSTTLAIARSCRTEAIRACVSMITKEDFGVFEERVRAFRRDH
jgi:aspartate/methionine/tyrosine aminotransferase